VPRAGAPPAGALVAPSAAAGAPPGFAAAAATLGASPPGGGAGGERLLVRFANPNANKDGGGEEGGSGASPRVGASAGGAAGGGGGASNGAAAGLLRSGVPPKHALPAGAAGAGRQGNGAQPPRSHQRSGARNTAQPANHGGYALQQLPPPPRDRAAPADGARALVAMHDPGAARLPGRRARRGAAPAPAPHAAQNPDLTVSFNGGFWGAHCAAA
jgi:hypothetical protein